MSSSSPWSPGAALTPLADSDGEWSEPGDSDDFFDDISSYDKRDIYGMSPVSKIQGNNSVSHSKALADRLNMLDLKAHEYTIAGALSNSSSKRANHEFRLVYLEENRFNAREAAALEEQFQKKVRFLFEKRRAEEIRRAREEWERQARAAEEAARRAAEERARQEEMQQRQREQEEHERRRKQDELARAEAEKQRVEQEQKNQEAAQKEAELKKQEEVKAANDRAAQAAQQQQQQQQQHQQHQQQQQQQQQKYTGPQVYGRKVASAEAAAVSKVLASLKKVRQDVTNEPQFMKSKNLMAIRRELRPKLGQLNGEKQQTIAVREFFKTTFGDLLRDTSGPMISANNFFLTPGQNSDVVIPIAFIWAVNELAKLLVKQVEAECSIKPETADPIGITIIATFANADLTVNGKSFIDIIISRLLKKNPILRGELGPEDTEAGRKRLGWKFEGGKWEAEEAHINALVGLTAGYAAIAGRDFGSSKMVNPYPIFNLWHAVAALLNHPMEKLTNSHFFVMKTLLQVGAKKLVGVYGHQAKKLVELCITDWAIKGVEFGLGGASAVKAYGKFLREEDWWKNS